MNIPMNIPRFFGLIWFFKVATSEAVATCQGLRWVEQLRSVALDDYFDFNGIYPQKINFNKPTLWCFHGINYIFIYIYIYVEGFMWLWVSNRERIDTWCLVGSGGYTILYILGPRSQFPWEIRSGHRNRCGVLQIVSWGFNHWRNVNYISMKPTIKLEIIGDHWR